MMRLIIIAVGRMRSGSEKSLLDHYIQHAVRMSRILGVHGPDVVEVNESRKSQRSRGVSAALSGIVGRRKVVLLDETGCSWSSPRFADFLSCCRDDSVSSVVFLIGGPDGHDAGMVAEADITLSLGLMTWPHMLVRVMLAEQIYRALSLLAGHPYHRSG